MFIRNENLANTELRLSAGLVAKGDDEGIFEVPDDTGAILIKTPGWSQSDKAPKKSEEIDPVAALRELQRLQGRGEGKPVIQPPQPVTAAPAASAPPQPPVPPAPVPTPPAAEDTPASAQNDAAEVAPDEAEEGPDLTGMTKAQLIETAGEYDVELPADVKKMKVDDLREYLDKKLYGEGSEG